MIATIPVTGLTVQRDGGWPATDAVASAEGDFVSILAQIASKPVEHPPNDSQTEPNSAESVEVTPSPLPPGFSIPSEGALPDMSAVMPVPPTPPVTPVPLGSPAAPAQLAAPVPAATPTPAVVVPADRSSIPDGGTVLIADSPDSTVASGPMPDPGARYRLPETAAPSPKSAQPIEDAPLERLPPPVMTSASLARSMTAKPEAVSFDAVTSGSDAPPVIPMDTEENVSNIAEFAAKWRIAAQQTAPARNPTSTAGGPSQTKSPETATDGAPIDRPVQSDTPLAPATASARPSAAVADAQPIPQSPEAEGAMAPLPILPSRTPSTDRAALRILGETSDAAHAPRFSVLQPEQRVTPPLAPDTTTATVIQALADADQPLPSAALLPAIQPAATPGTSPAPPSAPPPHLVPDILALAVSGADGPVTLQLRPEELGLLQFHVTRTVEGTHIHLTVEQPATLDLLRRHADDLLADLQRAGFGGATLSYGGAGDGEGARDSPAPAQDDPPDPPPPTPFVTLPLRQAVPGSLDLRL